MFDQVHMPPSRLSPCRGLSRRLLLLSALNGVFLLTANAAEGLQPELPSPPLPAIPGMNAPRLAVVDLHPGQVALGVHQDHSFVQAAVFNAGRSAAGSALRAGTSLTRGIGTGFAVEARPGRSEAMLQTVLDPAPGLRLGLATGRSWHRDHYFGLPSKQDVTQEHWTISVRRHWNSTALAPDMRISAFSASAHGSDRIDFDSGDPASERAVDGGLQRGASLRLGLSPNELTRIAYGLTATVTDFTHESGKPSMTHSVALQHSLDGCARLRTSMESNGRDSTMALGLQQLSWRVEARHHLPADGAASSAVHLLWQSPLGTAPANRAVCREPLTILPTAAPVLMEAMRRPSSLPWSPAVRVVSGG